ERRVSGDRHDDLGMGNLFLRASPVAGGLNGHEDALGASGRHVASCFWVMEEVARHRDHLLLELLKALEGAWAEAVGVKGGRVGFLQYVRHIVTREVDQRKDLAATPVRIAG